MKKHFSIKITGFTLAEVLITLTIIGVIAALTIPSLLQNVNDAQYRVALKKSYSDFSQAINRLRLDNGGTLVGVFQNSADMVAKLSPYLRTVKTCPYYNQGCWHLANNWYDIRGVIYTWGDTPGMILGNGNLVDLGYISQDCTDTVQAGNTMPICAYMYEDINGFKGPNTLGKDVFVFWITQNGLSPAGYNDNRVGTCNTGSAGWGCAALYLLQ